MIHKAPDCPSCHEQMRFHWTDVSSMDRFTVATQWVCTGVEEATHHIVVIAVGDE